MSVAKFLPTWLLRQSLNTILIVLASLVVVIFAVIEYALYRLLGLLAAIAVAVTAVALLLAWFKKYGYGAFGLHLFVGEEETGSFLLRPADADPADYVRFVCISDTHNKHGRLVVPDGDVLLCSGDMTYKGTVEELKDFTDWLDALPHKHKVVVAGNHDFCLDREWYLDGGNWKLYHKEAEDVDAAEALVSRFNYLNQSEVEVEGLRVWGAPHQPHIPRRDKMAFNLDRGPDGLGKVWRKIPRGVDVVLTHGPAHGMRDQIIAGRANVGDKELRKAVSEVRPRFVVSGHIHEAAGVSVGSGDVDGVVFINAAVCTLLYRPYHYPIVFDVPRIKVADT